MRTSAREKCNLVAILFRCAPLSRPVDPFSRIRQIGRSRAQLSRCKRHPAPIPSLKIADYCRRSAEIYDLTSYVPAIPLAPYVDLRGDEKFWPRLYLTAGTARNHFATAHPVKIMIIIFPRAQNIAAIDTRYFARRLLNPVGFFSRRMKLSARRIISRAKTAKNVLSSPSSARSSFLSLSLSPGHGEDRFKRSS
jgi:hypothetical protein